MPMVLTDRRLILTLMEKSTYFQLIPIASVFPNKWLWWFSELKNGKQHTYTHRWLECSLEQHRCWASQFNCLSWFWCWSYDRWWSLCRDPCYQWPLKTKHGKTKILAKKIIAHYLNYLRQRHIPSKKLNK